MKKFYLLFLSFIFLNMPSGWSQCTNTTSFGSATILPGGGIVTISTCVFAGEFSTINGATAGQTLQFTSSIPIDEITIHSGSPGGPVVAFGTTPLVFVNTFTGTLFAHWNMPGCGIQTSCRTTTVQCTSCLSADLSITNTDFVTTYTPGSNGHTYIVEATNNGPSAITGATITDVFPPEITSTTWTVTYPGGGSGPANGSGNINALVNLPVGGKARFVINAHISLSAATPMVNTATVTAPTGVTDPNLFNNTATDTDNPKTADMSITKTDGTAVYTPGGTTTYIIVVTNNGPNDLAEHTITDILPPEITAANWAVSYTGGAAGPLNGTGNINVMIDFPSGSTATFTLTANISPSATGNLVNTASIASNGFIDPNPADNTATDTDILPCINTSSFGSATISTAGNVVTISTCNFAGEYSTINGATAGQTLQFTSSVPTDFITIHSGTPSGPVIAAGTTPLNFANTFTGTLYAHWNTPSCGTNSTCRTTTVQCIGCVSCTITCPANITVSNDANQCGAIVNYPAPTTSGSCGTITATPASGSFFPIGTTTVNVSSTAGPACTFTVTVNDTQAPVITCLAAVTVTCASALPAANAGAVPVTDNCPGAVVTHVGDAIGTQTCANKFTILRTYRATDAAGNTTDCVQTITVNDNIPPTLTCPANITVSCAAAVPAPNIALVTGVSDNCSGAVTVTHVSDVISSQTCTNKYTITRTYKATDICGNAATCTQIITVNDQTAPVITCPATITATTPLGFCTAVVNFTPTATDNCSGAVTIVSSPASGTAFPIGNTIVTSTATDACGNSSSCIFTVTVLDGQLPVITQQPVNRTVCAGTAASFTVTAITSPNANGLLSYQWQQWNGIAWANISGASAATFTVNNPTLAMNTNTFRCVITGRCTTINSGAATLYVNSLPSVLLSAVPSLSLLPNQTTTITAIATPPGGTFVWSLNGTAISGVNGTVLGPVTVDDAGTYRTVYTDPNGCVTISGDITVTTQPGEKLWVYPNPNNGHFSVRYYNRQNEKLSMNIYNPAGQSVYKREFTTTTAYTNMEVDLGSHFNDGIYIVEVVNESGRRVGAVQIVVNH